LTNPTPNSFIQSFKINLLSNYSDQIHKNIPNAAKSLQNSLPVCFKNFPTSSQKSKKKLKKSKKTPKSLFLALTIHRKITNLLQNLHQKQPNIRQILLFTSQHQTNLPKMGNFYSLFSKKVN